MKPVINNPWAAKCSNFWDFNLNPITMQPDNFNGNNSSRVDLTATKHVQEQGFKSMIV